MEEELDISPGMTVDQLALRANTTTRNVRNYQTQGLLPLPRLVGRVGYHDEGHLGRLPLIAQLQNQGFSLAGIAELLKAWEEGRSLADLLGFGQVLTAPWRKPRRHPRRHPQCGRPASATAPHPTLER